MNQEFKLNSYQIAYLIHTVTSYFERPDGSIVPFWYDLTEEQKQAASNAVKILYTTLHYTPEEHHNLWMRPLVEQGWSCGVYNKDKKTHPCIMAYDDLPESEKLKDMLWQGMIEIFRPYFTSDDEDEVNSLNSHLQ